MILRVAAIGRLPKGPERALCEHLRARCDAQARSARLGPVDLREIEPKAPDRGPEGEARLLSSAIEDCDRIVALDERGAALGSRDFAHRLRDWRDQGARRTGFLIGGADGLDPSLRARADLLLGFGALTWPHALARAMLLEQLYRAGTILLGHPYHREG